MDKIAVLIPCFNEAATIGKVVTDYKTYLPDAVIYVYDNNSTDGTAKIAEKAGAMIRHEYQQGKGNVIRRMFSEIDAECYLMADGDDTYPAEDAPKLVNEVLNRQADMVIGDRLSSTYYKENKRLFHNLGNNMVRWFINTLFKNDIQDIMTGYRAFSYRFVKTFPVLSSGFEIETEMTIHAVDKHMDIRSIVINYRDRPEGSVSKLNTYSDGFKVLRMIKRLFKTYRPGTYFGIIGGILMMISLIFLIPVLLDYHRTGLVERFPTLIVCGFVMIAALQSIFSGQILKTIYQKNRQDFELDLCRASSEFHRILSEKERKWEAE